MRRCDEILTAFGRQTPPGRGFLVRALERQPISLDAPIFQDFLTAAVADADTIGFGRLAEDVYFSKLARDRAVRASGGDTGKAGMWSAFLGRADCDSEASRPSPGNPGSSALLLSRVVAALDDPLRRDRIPAHAALPVLARIRRQSSLEAILRRAEGDTGSPDVLRPPTWPEIAWRSGSRPGSSPRNFRWTPSPTSSARHLVDRRLPGER